MNRSVIQAVRRGHATRPTARHWYFHICASPRTKRRHQPQYEQFVSGDSPQTKSGILRRECRYFCRYGSHCPLNLVGTEASGTSVHMARSTVYDGLYSLYIGLPGTIGASVGVGDLNTKGNALTTIITLRHTAAPPICIISKFSCSKQSPRYDSRVSSKMQVFFIKIFEIQNIVAILGSYRYNIHKEWDR